MENEPSKLSVILFSLEATAYRITKNTPSISDYRQEYYAHRFATGLMIYFWMSVTDIIDYYYPFKDGIFTALLVLIILAEVAISLTCKKRIEAIETNYNRHYSLVLWVIFLLFVIISFVYWFNSRTGHLPADYNKKN